MQNSKNQKTKQNKQTNKQQTTKKNLDIAEERKTYSLSYFQSGFNDFAIVNRFIFNDLFKNL